MKLKPWNKLTESEQNRYVTVLWQDGYSEQAIADFLFTTKGRIVRHRQSRLKLPTAGRVRQTGEINLKRFGDLLDLKEMVEFEDKGVASIAPPSPHEFEDALPEP